MSQIPVVVPSAGRAAGLSTHKAFAEIIVCIPESELGQYRQFHPDLEYVTHPDSLKGLTLKKQWIYEKFGDVFLTDDDVRDVHRRARIEGEPVRLTGKEANDVVDATAESARNLGVYLFGFSRETHPGHLPGVQAVASERLRGRVCDGSAERLEAVVCGGSGDQL